MHGSLLLGDRGDVLVEIASCWAIVLIVTSLFLWWPRTSNKVFGVFIPRLRKGRPLWRDLHAAGGVWTSSLLLFLILTGLPWANEWGSNLNRMMASAGIGYPESYRAHVNHNVTDSAPKEHLPKPRPAFLGRWNRHPRPTLSTRARHRSMSARPPASSPPKV